VGQDSNRCAGSAPSAPAPGCQRGSERIKSSDVHAGGSAGGMRGSGSVRCAWEEVSAGSPQGWPRLLRGRGRITKETAQR